MNNDHDFLLARHGACNRTAILNELARRGMVVCYVPGSEPREFQLATGKKGYFITRDVVDAAEHFLNCICDNYFGTPDLVGQAVSAYDPSEICLEGPLLVSSGPRAFDPAAPPAPGTPLSTEGGLIGIAQPGDEIIGLVSEVKSPRDPANGFAIRVDVSSDCVVLEDPAAPLKVEVSTPD